MSNSFFTTWNSSWTGGFSQGNDEDDILEDENAEYQEMQEKGFVLNAIKCARSVLESKIISSENDVVGILLYNTKQTRNVSQFPLIYMFQDMDQPDAQRIMELEKMEKDLENGQLNVTESCQDDQMVSYQDLFWICSTIFSQKAHKMGSKRIFLITNEDHPHATNPALQTSALRRAKDLNELGISIELFMFNKANKNFDLSLFYKNVVEEEDIQNAESKFEELMVRIRRKETKKRPLQKILFGLGENFNISLKVFLLFSPARKGNHVYLDSRTNNEVNVMTEYICKDSASNLLPSDIKNYFEYGGEKAIFNKDELLKIKKFGPAGLTLLGFKPKERLKLKYNLKNSYFIYPDDSQVKQSSLFFSHFLDKLEAKGKIAICRYIARDYSKPSIVALLPQKEQFDENGIQIKPPGAHLITLPFADDLRSLPNDSIQKGNLKFLKSISQSRSS
ncbi:Ku70/Ku80 beta-barrel domain-containing protein [Rozella allomycis CSF55]|uniref:Ku70/Ku80 beta-barrel domain-containing protein n=1 Tax=Rozella allomycis (strain CSF55) TaxID=988480 RepID=A0A075B577_ROZAC|nr:Ku70/Ku80 beta-barrel domain-containing protein [Rozella allomycis CSF55]|eukprot:EPZ36969.1 Ku70/Ku80 beta-barrel domain-containing protein [Rozella allomycis CSF55]